ncbi:hypothetical protein DMENIID0001_001050 [Sergentomyia squamirostris]
MNPSSSSNNYPEGVIDPLSDSTDTLLVVPKGTKVESSTQRSQISGYTKEYYRDMVEATEPMTLERALNSTSESESSSPTRPFIRDKKLKFLREQFKKLQKSNRQFYDKTRRQERKIKKLSDLIDTLKARDKIDNEIEERMRRLPKALDSIVKRLLSGKKKSAYTDKEKQFILTLNFLSPSAYEYIREEFGKCLPDTRTISRWYNGINGDPGFCKHAFDAIEAAQNNSSEQILVQISYDEMAIKQATEWTGKKLYGEVDFGEYTMGNDKKTGQKQKKKDDMLAKSVLVFMATAVNKNWKIGLGYFPVNKINGKQKANLAKICAEKLMDQCAVRVLGLTSDGFSANISAFNELGCNFKQGEIKSDFQVQQQRMYAHLDPPHMLKNIRNALQEKGPFLDAEGRQIDWKYLEALVRLQEKEECHLGTKIRKAHVFFKNQKMKVKLATQTFSRSVAVALRFCDEELNLPEFQGCEGTVNFIEMINDIFDVLNTRNPKARGYKKPICKENASEIFDFIDKANSYLSGLFLIIKDKVEGEKEQEREEDLEEEYEDHEEKRAEEQGDDHKCEKKDKVIQLIQSSRKCGFMGFVASLQNLKLLYQDLIETGILTYLPTYRLNQDHLELYFSSVRRKLGRNNNPTVFQFRAIFKKLLTYTQSVTNLCKAAEKALREFGDKYDSTEYSRIRRMILIASVEMRLFEDDNLEPCIDHKLLLIDAIVEKYLSVRLYYYHKQKSSTSSKRQMRNRLTIFEESGQTGKKQSKKNEKNQKKENGKKQPNEDKENQPKRKEKKEPKKNSRNQPKNKRRERNTLRTD